MYSWCYLRPPMPPIAATLHSAGAVVVDPDAAGNNRPWLRAKSVLQTRWRGGQKTGRSSMALCWASPARTRRDGRYNVGCTEDCLWRNSHWKQTVVDLLPTESINPNPGLARLVHPPPTCGTLVSHQRFSTSSRDTQRRRGFKVAGLTYSGQPSSLLICLGAGTGIQNVLGR